MREIVFGKGIGDPLEFGKTDQILVGYSKHVSSHVSLNSSECFGVRIPALMFGSLISAGNQVVIAKYSSPYS